MSPPSRSRRDLTDHDCINVRPPSHGGLLPWDFKKGSGQLNVRVEGTPTFNGFPQIIQATLAGLGLALTLEEAAQEHIDAGRLVRVLENWCAAFPGCDLYYPSRRQPSPAFSLVVHTLRYRA